MRKRKKGYQVLDVYNKLKLKIIMLELKPGQILEEKKLAKELEVGRTPVREALLLLKADGLIESHPNKTAYVKEITLKGVKDLFESLMAVEKIIARLAARRVTPEILKEIEKAEEETRKAVEKKDIRKIESYNRLFHSLIAKASGNSILFSIHENLRNQAERYSYLAISKDFEDAPSLKEHYTKLKDQHSVILNCLREKDVKKIEKISEEHIKLFQNRIFLFLTQSQI
jgi:DNA-binding GntR family transcriptional regulator